MRDNRVKRFERLFWLVALVAAIAFAVLSSRQPVDRAAVLRNQLAATHVSVPVSEGPIVAWETLSGKSSGAKGQALRASDDVAGQIVTGLSSAGASQVEEGDVVASLQGAPVIVLEGSISSYRALAPKMRGPDVDQLHAAMSRLGVPCGCLGALTKAEIANLLRWVLARAPTLAMDPTSWKQGIPPTSLIWMRQLPVRAERPLWAVGRAATAVFARTVSPDRNLSVQALPADSMVVQSNAVEVSSKSGAERVWRTKVARITASKDENRHVELAGVAPAWLAGPVSIRIRTTAEEGKALIVPAAAVGIDPGGQARLLLATKQGTVRRDVTIVAELQGTLAVRGKGLHGRMQVVLR